jgi:hypothetical protein
MIGDTETCIELNKYADGPIIEGTHVYDEPVAPVAARKPDEPAIGKKPEKKSRWKAWGDKLSRLMSEDDVTEDDQ